MYAMRYGVLLLLLTLLSALVCPFGATEIAAKPDVRADAVADAIAASVKDEALSTLLRHPRAQQLQGRILNGAQFVQHSQSAQSFYLPPDLSKLTPVEEQSTNQLQPHQQHQQHQHHHQPQQLQPEVIQVQVPADEKKILLRLPAQQLPRPLPLPLQQQQQQHPQHPQQQQQQAQFPAYQPPPRRHYKIILVRSPPVQKPPPVPATPAVEEQTLIYVLVKKPDEPNAADLQALQQMQQDAVKFSKPEVYFIKYKANEQQQQQQHAQQQQQQEQQPVSIGVSSSSSSITPSQSQQEQISNIIQRQLQRNGNVDADGTIAEQQQQQQPMINSIGHAGYP